MASFFTTLTNTDLANQIAGLLNQHNKLRKQHTQYTILNDPANYFVEIAEDKVAGCGAIRKVDDNCSLINHICVNPLYRKKGIAKKIIKSLMMNSFTLHVFMTIREDNVASLSLARSAGFLYLGYQQQQYYKTLIFGRRI
jgi:ribosomal protein S18 acetylase RimI-like enzyme